MPSRATIERLAATQPVNSTAYSSALDEMAAHFGYEARGARSNDDYIAVLDAASEQRLASSLDRYTFAAPPANVRTMASASSPPPASVTEASDAAIVVETTKPVAAAAVAVPKPMDVDAVTPPTPPAQDAAAATQQPPSPSVRDPIEAARIAVEAKRAEVEAKRAEVELRKRLAETEAASAELRRKAELYDKQQAEETARWQRELESALKAFEDAASRSKKHTPEQITRTRSFAEAYAKTNPQDAIANVRGMLETMVEASAANERAERAEFEAKRARRASGYDAELSNIDRQLGLYQSTLRSLDAAATVVPTMAPVVSTPPTLSVAPKSMNYSEPPPPAKMDIRPDTAAAAAVPPPAAKLPPLGDSSPSFLACSESAAAGLPDIATEYRQLKKALGREPTIGELQRGAELQVVGFDENSLTGARTERYDLVPRSRGPYWFGMDTLAPAEYARVSSLMRAQTGPTANRTLMVQASAAKLVENQPL